MQLVKTLKRFYSFFRKRKLIFFFFVFFTGLATIADNLSPYIYKLLTEAIERKEINKLIKLIFLFIGLKLLAQYIFALAHYLSDKLFIPTLKEARIKIFNHLQFLDFAFHSQKSTGKLISLFKRGQKGFRRFFYIIHDRLLPSLISLVVMLFFFNKVIPLIAILMFFVLLINGLISAWLIRINLKTRKEFNPYEDKVFHVIVDSLINYEAVKLFAQEKREEQRLKKEFQGWEQKHWEFGKSFRLMELVLGTSSGLGLLLVLTIATQALTNGLISTGDLIMVLGFTVNFYYQFFGIFYQLRDLAENYSDLEEFLAILDKETKVKDPPKPVFMKKIKGEIVFENVSFSYPLGQQNALINFNLKIKPGETIALVGRSGAGKTTIIKLLLRFFDPDKGRILIDGIDIKKIKKRNLRSFIGVVPQEPLLFNDTIAFNIGYGKQNVKRKEIERAAKMANAHQFIKTLPKGYDTFVGEKGVKLSGGQKQRIAIARMLLTNPKIIIFDEATSQLDSESEKLIQEALWKIAKKRTTIIIAHRLTTIQKAKRIIVLDNGKLKEQGSYSQLMKKRGLFYLLWKLQFKEGGFV